jgi:hypothetical protein
MVWVWKTEEKGSDVNLATHLLHDAYRNDHELAVVISNDSDLVVPIQIVRHELGKPVGVFVPPSASAPAETCKGTARSSKTSAARRSPGVNSPRR